MERKYVCCLVQSNACIHLIASSKCIDKHQPRPKKPGISGKNKSSMITLAMPTAGKVSNVLETGPKNKRV